MSQPCSAVELVLFDARALLGNGASAREALHFARDRGIGVGAIGDFPDLASCLGAVGIADTLDFWITGQPGEWPLERVYRLIDVEPGRVLFMSDDPEVASLAERGSMRPIPATREDLERALA